MKKWKINSCDKSRAAQIAEELGIPVITAAMLLLKGFDDEIEIEEFLSEESDLADPFDIKDMDKAVARIERAVERGEKVCIFGDYDADGVTSATLLYQYLKSVWCDVIYYIPDRRTEGYGMNMRAVDKLHNLGMKLIITVDNGISACKEIAYASSLGIDTVVTDHHKPPKELPEAVAVVDPHRLDDESEFKHLSGVGVAFKLVMALERSDLDLDDLFDRYADLCALGTVADVVSLTGENRMLVREGLRRINEGCCIGIEALKTAAGCGENITSTDIGFKLAPRINAAGRLHSAYEASHLLLSEDEEEAAMIAENLSDFNDERKSVEDTIIESVVATLNKDASIRSKRVIVVSGEDWHEGVIGLAAAKIKEKFGKPTIVISVTGDKAKGSARSVEGFPINEGIAYCADLLTIFGGHPMAAGLSMPAANIEAFREKINEYAMTVDNDYLPTLEIMATLKRGTMRVEELESILMLEPFGAGNESPVFAFIGAAITDIAPLKDGKYLRMTCSCGGVFTSVVCFMYSYEEFPYRKGDVVDIAVSLSLNEYNGNTSVSASMEDIKFSDDDNGALLLSKRTFDDYISGCDVTDDIRKELDVTRDDFAAVYKYIRKNGGADENASVLLHRIGNKTLTLGKLLIIIQAMTELRLIESQSDGEKLTVEMIPSPPRVDILSAPVLKRLKN